MVTPELAAEAVRCDTSGIEHGSDYLPIRAEFTAEVDEQTMQPRRLWKKAKWKKIREALASKLMVMYKVGRLRE
jgi:hypothetical protein